MTVSIHPSSLVDPEVSLGKNVHIGPFCIVKKGVQLGDNCILQSHCVIEGKTTIGAGNTFGPFCALGLPPQDKSYKGEETEVLIGENNIFREYCSIHRGTTKENLKTVIGSHNFFMSYIHFGHDVVIGNNCIIANTVNFAGHVHLGDRCVLGGGTNISQFCRIGRGVYLGGGSGVDRDIPPFCTAYGNRILLKGVNIIGLKRMGISKEVISDMVDFFRQMESSHLSQRNFCQKFLIDYPSSSSSFALISEFIEFVQQSSLGIAGFMA